MSGAPGSLVTVTASAPVRLDFAGGWTDVPPFSADEGGVVVAAAIGHRAHAHVAPGGDAAHISAEDLGESATFAADAAMALDGRLDLHKAALRLHAIGPCRLTTRSDVPPGSGLGSSGALDVALVAALSAARGAPLDPAGLAAAGCVLERDEAGIAGGKQDQYMAALGGFQQLVFDDPSVEASRLALDPAFEAELARCLVLCYTGMSRVSGRTISRVVAAYERREPAVVRALHGMREVALEMVPALLASDLARVALLLSRNWAHQRALDPVMQTEGMARLEAAASSAGALGGKAAGSGAGGSMFFIAPGAAAASAVAASARAAGATILPVTWSSDGVRVC